MDLTLSKKMASFTENLSPKSDTFQAKAFDHLMTLDFPTTRDEYWKYTRLGKISNATFTTEFETLPTPAIADYIVASHYLVIENGTFRDDLSQYEGTAFNISFKTGELCEPISSFNKNLKTEDVFNTINNSQFNSVVHIKVNKNQQIETPLQIIYIGQGENTIANNRLLVEVGQSASAEMIATYVNIDNNSQFDNSIAEFNIGENAQFTIHKIQAGNDKTLQVCTEDVTQAANSTFKINTVTVSGLLQRNNINIAVEGQNCETHMNGAIISKGKQHIDNHTFVDHQVSNCFSNENYKYVLNDQSTGVFNGRVVVRQDAQVINAYQNNGNILLSDEASINSKPELEIYADDVKCSHGSTTGQLDENALFYLQARGISKENAKKLLVAAFVGEVIEAIENEKVVGLIHTLLEKEHGWNAE